MVIKIQESKFAKKGTGVSESRAGFLHVFVLWPYANLSNNHFSVFKIGK